MANVARLKWATGKPATIVMMAPAGQEPFFELAQYGEHNEGEFGYQVEPRLDRYQVNDNFSADKDRYTSRETMQNMAFQQPSAGDMAAIAQVGDRAPMLDEFGEKIGDMVQFSAHITTDEHGYPSGIDSASIQPTKGERGEHLPAGANLLQDMAKRAHNDYHDQYLDYERTGQVRPFYEGQPSAYNHPVTRQANSVHDFRAVSGASGQWSKYVNTDPEPLPGAITSGPFAGFAGSATPSERARHYLDTSRAELVHEDTSVVRAREATAFGAHNPVKASMRNANFADGYNPVANRPGGPGFPGVAPGTGLGYEMGMHQEKIQAERAAHEARFSPGITPAPEQQGVNPFTQALAEERDQTMVMRSQPLAPGQSPGFREQTRAPEQGTDLTRGF